MVANDRSSDLTFAGVEAQALQDDLGNGDAPFGMSGDAARLGDIVQEKDGVEERGCLRAQDDLAVAPIDLGLTFVNLV